MTATETAIDNTAQAERTVTRLRATFKSGRTRGYRWRMAQLRRLERMLAECEKEIIAAIGKDLGRGPGEAWLGDIASTQAEVAYARKHLRRWMRPKRVALPLTSQPGRAWYQYEPLGTVLVIGPWNYPIYLALAPLVAALAAGNCAVVKPSEHAPASSAALAWMLPHYLDSDAVAVVEGEAGQTQALIEQGVDHVFFTGGTEIGRLIAQAAAPHLTPVTLELGGKSPVIVTSDADLEVAARRIAWTKLMNSGQTCVAPDYVLADRRVSDRLVRLIDHTVREFRGAAAGDGMPIVNRRQFDRLAAALAGSDGTVAMGGSVDADACVIEPTVVVDPSPDSPLMTEEIFGPVLPVITVDSLDEAIAFVDKRPKPLAAYLFAKSRSARRRVVEQISAGGMVVNHAAMHVLVPQLPFGGVGDSGMGAYHGKWGFEALSHRKSVLTKPARPDLKVVYPPYTAEKLKLMRRFF